MFSDGIRPGGDLTELDGSNVPRLPIRRSNRSVRRMQRAAAQQAAAQQAAEVVANTSDTAGMFV